MNDCMNRICFLIIETKVTIHPFNIKKLLPSNTHNFYRYKGSLTTPRCYESVFWTLFVKPVHISQKQVRK